MNEKLQAGIIVFAILVLSFLCCWMTYRYFFVYSCDKCEVGFKSSKTPSSTLINANLKDMFNYFEEGKCFVEYDGKNFIRRDLLNE